jgi:hypothetical protein
MSPPFPERPTGRDLATSQRDRQEFAGVCGRLHFFFLQTDAPPHPGGKKAAHEVKFRQMPANVTFFLGETATRLR